MLYSGVSWAMDLLTHLLHYFFVILPSFFIIPLCLYPLFYLLSLSSRFFLCHEWWPFTFQCMEDIHVPFHSYLMDIGSEILSLEGHLVRESSPTSLFKSISISLCIMKGTHLLIFRVCAGKRKKEEVISACMYVYNVILHWGCFIELGDYESPYVNFQEAFIFLCLSRYVSYVWETNDLFLGTSNYCLIHQSIR